MKSLMHFCRNWGDLDCHSEVSKFKNPKELKEGKDIPFWPEGDELAEVNEICKKCEARFFEIEEKMCLVCEGTNFKEIRGFMILNEKDKKKFENYYLKCTQCETPSVLKKMF